MKNSMVQGEGRRLFFLCMPTMLMLEPFHAYPMCFSLPFKSSPTFGKSLGIILCWCATTIIQSHLLALHYVSYANHYHGCDTMLDNVHNNNINYRPATNRENHINWPSISFWKGSLYVSTSKGDCSYST
jgi:hypothetical protein